MHSPRPHQCGQLCTGATNVDGKNAFFCSDKVTSFSSVGPGPAAPSFFEPGAALLHGSFAFITLVIGILLLIAAGAAFRVLKFVHSPLPL